MISYLLAFLRYIGSIRSISSLMSIGKVKFQVTGFISDDFLRLYYRRRIVMNQNQQDEIKRLRNQGMGYKRIASELEISIDAVKYFCRKNGLTGTKDISSQVYTSHCKECGLTMIQIRGMKVKKFCSNNCRQKWWNKNRNQLHRKQGIEVECPCCGKGFTAYQNEQRKYCSHDCYIKYRFGGDGHESA